MRNVNPRCNNVSVLRFEDMFPESRVRKIRTESSYHYKIFMNNEYIVYLDPKANTIIFRTDYVLSGDLFENIHYLYRGLIKNLKKGKKDELQ